MIRTTCEASLFSLWRDSSVLDLLVRAEHLTTGRHEPISRMNIGTSHVDLLFERPEQSCVVSGIRLDPNNLITRERSPIVWPAHVASLLDTTRLQSIEQVVIPWLRSLARARPMAREAIRRFAPSERFDRARVAGMLGAAALEPVMRRMAPFVYARRFATGRRVLLDSVDEALGYAVLEDLAESIAYSRQASVDDRSGDQAFARAWYGVELGGRRAPGASDVAIVDRRGLEDAPIVIEISQPANALGITIDVPLPAPWELLFSFDAADAPVTSRFSVRAPEPPLRRATELNRPNICGNSAGRIVLAMSAEAVAMRGFDVGEAEVLKQCLSDEGFAVNIISDTSDPLMVSADLVHIFGGAFESHTIAFALAARARGVDFLFDVAPWPLSPASDVENFLPLAFRAASDDTECARYLEAYEERRLNGTPTLEPSAAEHAATEERFAELATSAVAVLGGEEDIVGLRARLPTSVADRVLTRGIFAAPEPLPAPIGHLVPSAPFAFVHATLGETSHALFTAYAAGSNAVPLVVGGPFYDVDYLQTLRAIAPNAIVLVDPDPGVISALYRRATIWVDAAPRPRSAAGLIRAVACGALPVLAIESPLVRFAGAGVPTFRLTSFQDCATTLGEAMASTDCDKRIAGLQARLAKSRDLAVTFGGLIAAYARAATPV